MEVIHIYHTNDLHSHFENWPRIHQFLIDRKIYHQKAGEEFFLFDIGDHADRWHPLTEATKGKGNVELLNRAGYHAVTIGNNEGITFPFEDLNHLYDEREFDVVLANLYDKSSGDRPNWVKDHVIYETKKGIKMAITGLTANFGQLYNLLGWELTDPIVELKKQLTQLEGQFDVMVLLSHLGIRDDEKIGQEFSNIDVVIGGHTHHVLQDGQLENDTLLTCAGKYGMYVGYIRLVVDPITPTIMEKKARLFDFNELPQVTKEEEAIEQLYDSGKGRLSVPVVTLDSDYLDREELAQLLVDATREWCDADCAIINEGLIIKSLSSKQITKYDLLTICPHPINPCTVQLSGLELKEVLIQSLDSKWEDMKLMGLGFRGKIMGKMIYSEIKINPIPNPDTFLINGMPIENEKIYKVAVPDMFTFGRFFPFIFQAKHKHYFLPEFLRHVLEWKLSESSKQITK